MTRKCIAIAAVFLIGLGFLPSVAPAIEDYKLDINSTLLRGVCPSQTGSYTVSSDWVAMDSDDWIAAKGNMVGTPGDSCYVALRAAAPNGPATIYVKLQFKLGLQDEWCEFTSKTVVATSTPTTYYFVKYFDSAFTNFDGGHIILYVRSTGNDITLYADDCSACGGTVAEIPFAELSISPEPKSNPEGQLSSWGRIKGLYNN